MTTAATLQGLTSTQRDQQEVRSKFGTLATILLHTPGSLMREQATLRSFEAAVHFDGLFSAYAVSFTRPFQALISQADHGIMPQPLDRSSQTEMTRDADAAFNDLARIASTKVGHSSTPAHHRIDEARGWLKLALNNQ